MSDYGTGSTSVIESFKQGLDAALRSSIDAFIETHFEEDASDDYAEYHAFGAQSADGAVAAATVSSAETPNKPSIGERLGHLLDFGAGSAQSFAELEEEAVATDLALAPAAARPHAELGDAAPSDLKSWLDTVDEPFSTTLLRLIDERDLDDVDVYKRAQMSRQLFSRIRSDADYRPAKKTVLALAVALDLDVQETRDLLERAGFALSRSSKRDVIVEYFIERGPRDLFAINQALYEYDQPLL